MLLVLTGVTAVSVALLAYVNELTKGPIAEANAKTLNEALKKVLPEYTNNPVAESDTVFSEKDGKKIVDFIIYPAKNGEKWVGSAVEAKSMGFGGELKVLVGFDAEGKIYNYSLLAHAETPGLGSKADKWFGAYDPAKNEKPVSHEESAKSILGMNPGETPLAVTKDMNGQVDAITASTITSRAFLNAVNAAYQAYKGGEVDTNSGASQKNEPAVAPEGEAAANDTNNYPIFVLLLGMCPTLGTTSSAINGMGMGLATMFVLICSNVVISSIKNLIPDMVRIPSFIVVIASFVTLLQMIMQAYVPDLYATLGLFIPLIVVNCIVLGRAEAFAAKNNPLASMFDGIGMGFGFTIALTLLGAVREFLGTGKIFNLTILPEEYGMLIFVLAPGAFIALGYLIAIINSLKKA